MKTKIIKENVCDAAELLKQGELVAVPTETVYGLAGNGLNAEAVEKIYEVKGRPQIKALSLMVPDESAMDRYCTEVPEQAKALARSFWPGPLTIVLKSKDIVPDIVRAGGQTVALRCPDHALTLELLRTVKLPLAAPSANPSGLPSPKNAEQVLFYFDGKISAVIDGGECGIGTESTIIDMSKAPYKILREAALSEKTVKKALADNVTVYGITGGTGCGKTTALNELKKLGALIIDADAVYHELLESDSRLLGELEAEFPAAFENGALQRKRLGEVVFNDKVKLNRLNEIAHAHVEMKIDDMLADWAMQGGTIAALDAIALIESGVAARCKKVFGVVAETETRAQRIMARDNISREYALMRIKAQKPNEFFEEHCDYILRNDASQEEFAQNCKKLFKEVLDNE